MQKARVEQIKLLLLRLSQLRYSRMIHMIQLHVKYTYYVYVLYTRYTLAIIQQQNQPTNLPGTQCKANISSYSSVLTGETRQTSNKTRFFN